jgi:hypothetical protein
MLLGPKDQKHVWYGGLGRVCRFLAEGEGFAHGIRGDDADYLRCRLVLSRAAVVAAWEGRHPSDHEQQSIDMLLVLRT